MRAHITLVDRKLDVTNLEVGLFGGTLAGSVTVDARGVATVEWSRAKSAKDAKGADILPARGRGSPVADLPPVTTLPCPAVARGSVGPPRPDR